MPKSVAPLTARWIAVLLALFAMGIPADASTTTWEGCFVCSDQGTASHFCAGAREGAGWRCTETDIQGFTICSITGGPCLNPDYGGGTGGGGGGGGGSCQSSSGFCPAECFSCGGGGRPRI
jgi:hypothetical protein